MTILDLPRPPQTDPDLSPEMQIVELQRWCEEFRERTLELLRGFDREMQRRQFPVDLPEATVAELTTDMRFRAGQRARMVYVLDETGGAVPAFSDGTDWRRVTDRVVIS